MKFAQWGSLPKSVRIAAVAFAVHAFLLAMYWLFFATPYGSHGSSWSGALRIVVFCISVWSVLTEVPSRVSRRLAGLLPLMFLLIDLTNLSHALGAEVLTGGQALLTVGLLLSLMVPIGALWWDSIRPILRTPAA
ncbi:MAG: hypothetical protein QOH59_2628 [Gemmatimonadales bacterium]|jgi:hypothetical protein|nr:hypothetical protein [Gemmatimonadales bacterium]